MDIYQIYLLCYSKDESGELFCYVSGTALCACGDVQASSRQDKYLSYEACITPPRNECQENANNENVHSGDFPFCQKGLDLYFLPILPN